jgi:hypothetical protein
VKKAIIVTLAVAAWGGACSPQIAPPAIEIDASIDSHVASVARSDVADTRESSTAIDSNDAGADSIDAPMETTPSTPDDGTDADFSAESSVDFAAIQWTCPHGQSFGPATAIAWPFALTGSERISANGATVIWRDSSATALHVADLSVDVSDAASTVFTQIDDIAGSYTCGDFAIAGDGLTVVCVTPDGVNLETFSRAIVGTDFGAANTLTFGDFVAALATDAGGPALSHPLMPANNALIVQVQGVGIVASTQLFPGDPWSQPTLVYDPGALTLDGAYDTATLFLWDPTALTTTIAWQWLDGHWELDPLGSEQHVTPNLDCTGAYYLWNGAINFSDW